ncbi:MAG: FG-GAP repeat protein, partial [Planctomycetaceae bacterium]|nr:FG-GAP repeat protein [Planctomycetaceae bacterium]
MNRLTQFLAAMTRRSPKTRRLNQRALIPVPSEVEPLEERLVLSPGILAVGVGSGSIPRVGVFNSENGAPLYEFNPYPDVTGFLGGVQTAVGYLPDSTEASVFPFVITAPGPGIAINNPVRIFSGVAGTLFSGQFVQPATLVSFLNPYPGFAGGINVAATDFDQDGYMEVITGAGPGGGPHVKVFRFPTLNVVFSQFVYDAGFTGGVRVAAGKVNVGDA